MLFRLKLHLRPCLLCDTRTPSLSWSCLSVEAYIERLPHPPLDNTRLTRCHGEIVAMFVGVVDSWHAEATWGILWIPSISKKIPTLWGLL